jgi:hypothetical protein
MFGEWRCAECKQWGEIFDETGKWTEHYCKDQVLVHVPHIPFGPKGMPGNLTDADYYRSAARTIRHQANVGEPFAGSLVTEAVAKLCDNAAEALDALGDAS